MFKQKLLKAFTLIELLIVIAVLGVLAGAVLVTVNPQDKLAQANDSKVQSDISQIATAVAAYVAQNGYYPTSNADTSFVGTGKEISSWPAQPTGYTAYVYTVSPAGCNNTTTLCTSGIVTGQLKAARYTATPTQRWESPSGKVCQVLNATTACP